MIIRYFGMLKDILGVTEEQIEWHGGDSDSLLDALRGRSPVWADALGPGKIFRLAVNRQIIYDSVALNPGDEVAILPPVTGG